VVVDTGRVLVVLEGATADLLPMSQGLRRQRPVAHRLVCAQQQHQQQEAQCRLPRVHSSGVHACRSLPLIPSLLLLLLFPPPLCSVWATWAS
jgi:hypothetical protein